MISRKSRRVSATSSPITAPTCTARHPVWGFGKFGDVLDNELVKRGDAYAGKLVAVITGASFWSQGNNAIVITFDEGNGTKGCCDADPGTEKSTLR